MNTRSQKLTDALRSAAQAALDALEDSISVPAYHGHPKQEAAADGLRAALSAEPQEPAQPVALIERLRAAVEGECDGLAITLDQARAILEYVLDAAPPQPAEPAPPVIAVVTTSHDYGATIDWTLNPLPSGTELYAAPPQPAPLTPDKDKPNAVNVPGYGYVDVKAVRAVERAIRESK